MRAVPGPGRPRLGWWRWHGGCLRRAAHRRYDRGGGKGRSDPGVSSATMINHLTIAQAGCSKQQPLPTPFLLLPPISHSWHTHRGLPIGEGKGKISLRRSTYSLGVCMFVRQVLVFPLLCCIITSFLVAAIVTLG